MPAEIRWDLVVAVLGPVGPDYRLAFGEMATVNIGSRAGPGCPTDGSSPRSGRCFPIELQTVSCEIAVWTREVGALTRALDAAVAANAV